VIVDSLLNLLISATPYTATRPCQSWSFSPHYRDIKRQYANPSCRLFPAWQVHVKYCLLSARTFFFHFPPHSARDFEQISRAISFLKHTHKYFSHSRLPSFDNLSLNNLISLLLPTFVISQSLLNPVFSYRESHSSYHYVPYCNHCQWIHSRF
jgi:hypothetical protein